MANPMFHCVLWLCSWNYDPSALYCIILPKLYFYIKIVIVYIFHSFTYWHMVFSTLLFETCKATSKYMNNDIHICSVLVCPHFCSTVQCSNAYEAQIDVVKYFFDWIWVHLRNNLCNTDCAPKCT